MTLQAEAVTAGRVEATTLALLNEWLASWFDGQPHAIGEGSTPVAFPRANRAFGQGEPVQPLYDLGTDTACEIRVTVRGRRESVAPMDCILFRGHLATQQVLLQFAVSAKRPGKGQSARRAQWVADLLKALLTNPDARYPLAQKGITQLTPSPVVVMASVDYAKRWVACGAQIQYGVQFGGGAGNGGVVVVGGITADDATITADQTDVTADEG